MTRPNKDKSVQFRVDETQLDALERVAEREGETLANWCRRNLLKLAGWRPDGERGGGGHHAQG